jgi:protein gp37
MGQEKYADTTRISAGRPKWNGTVSLDESALNVPLAWKRGRFIFVNSMSDLFHDAVPLEFIIRVFDVMRDTPQHKYQILTKRSERLRSMAASLDWPNNVWMGVSVESEAYAYRIDDLLATPAKVKFLSLEPLLGPLPRLSLAGIDWAIVGGESGPNARPIKEDWVRSIRDQCVEAGVAFHFKQWGGKVKSRNGRLLDGRTWDEIPAIPSSATTL